MTCVSIYRRIEFIDWCNLILAQGSRDAVNLHVRHQVKSTPTILAHLPEVTPCSSFLTAHKRRDMELPPPRRDSMMGVDMAPLVGPGRDRSLAARGRVGPAKS